MPTFPQILWAFALPAILVAAMVLIPLGRFAIRRSGLIAIAVAAGFALAYWHTVSTPGSPGADTKDWLIYATIPLALLAVCDNLFRPPLWLSTALLLILSRISIRVILYKRIPDGIDPSLAEIYVDLISLIAVGWWLSLESLALRIPGPTAPLVLCLVAAGAAAAMIVFPSFQNAPLAGSISMMCFIAGAACYFRRDLSISRGPVIVIISLMLLLMTHGFFYSKASDAFNPRPLTLLAIMLASPLAAFIGDLPGIRNWPAKARLAMRLIAVGLLISVVVPGAIRDIKEQIHPPASTYSE